MKTTIASVLALLAFASAHAQTLRPELVNGAVLGGVAGAIIGNNSGDLRHNAWRGAAYGAGAGLLLGAISADAHDRRYGGQVPVPDYPRTYVYREPPLYYRSTGYYGRGWSHGHRAHYGYGGYYRRPVYYGNAGYYGDVVYDDGFSGRQDYRGSGLLLGALAGAVIGNNSGDLRHNAWRGAAYGAGLGYLLGSVAERQARQREAIEGQSTQVISSTPANASYEPAATGGGSAASGVTSSATAAPAQPARSTSSMSAANSLFGRK